MPLKHWLINVFSFIISLYCISAYKCLLTVSVQHIVLNVVNMVDQKFVGNEFILTSVPKPLYQNPFEIANCGNCQF